MGFNPKTGRYDTAQEALDVGVKFYGTNTYMPNLGLTEPSSPDGGWLENRFSGEGNQAGVYGGDGVIGMAAANVLPTSYAAPMITAAGGGLLAGLAKGAIALLATSGLAKLAAVGLTAVAAQKMIIEVEKFTGINVPILGLSAEEIAAIKRSGIGKKRTKQGLFNKRALKTLKQSARYKKQYRKYAKTVGLKVTSPGRTRTKKVC